MENESLGNDFLSEDNKFNITADLGDDFMADSILGGNVNTDIKDVKPIEETPKVTKETKEQPAKEDKPAPIPEDKAADLLLGEDEDEDINDIKVTKPDPKAKTETHTDEDDTSGNEFEDLANDLAELGIFSAIGDEEETLPTTGEELRERFDKEINYRVQQGMYDFITSRHGEEGWLAFDAMFNKGVPPSEYAQRYAALESVKDLDLTVESNQERVVRQYYKGQGWKDEKLDAKIQRLKNSEELADEADTLHSLLVQNEEQALQATIAQQEENQKRIAYQKQQYGANLNQILSNGIKAKEIGGIPVTKELAQQTFDELFRERYHNASTGETFTEFDKFILELRQPQNHEEKVKLWLLSKLLKTDPELKTFKRKAISQESDKLFNSLRRKEKTNKTHATFTPNNPNVLEGL